MTTFLIVDDVEQNRKLFRIILEDGFPDALVLEAENGAVGLEIARNQRPDLILMDIRMPVLDGLSATRQLKADPAIAGIPVLLVTSSVSPETEIRLRKESGADGCLSKPISINPFLTEIRRQLGEGHG